MRYFSLFLYRIKRKCRWIFANFVELFIRSNTNQPSTMNTPINTVQSQLNTVLKDMKKNQPLRFGYLRIILILFNNLTLRLDRLVVSIQ